MLTWIEIENFRGLDGLTVKDLARVTLVTGSNGAGKTSFLEAGLLFVAEGNASVLAHLQAHRGMVRYASLEPIAASVFGRYGSSGTITIRGGSKAGDGVLKITRRKQNGHPTSADSRAGHGLESQDGRIRFTYDPGKRTSEIFWNTSVDPARPAVDRTLKIRAESIILWPGGAPDEADRERFGELKRLGEKRRLIKAIQLFDPNIKDVDYLFTADGSYFAVQLGSARGYVPLGMLGGGASRFLNMLLAVHFARRGTVFIDEIEDGIHYSNLEKVFGALVASARRYGTQLIITTHSDEALRAFAAVAAETPEDDFSHLYLLRRDGIVRPQLLRERDALTAVKSGLELR